MDVPTDKRAFSIKWGCGGCLGLVVAFVGFAWGMLHFTPWNNFPTDALEALRQDPAAIFYSLEPGSGESRDGFQGYKIVGQITLDHSSDRNEMADRLTAATQGEWGDSACFEPRHGFRARGPKGQFDILLCFECGKAYVYFPDGRSERIGIIGGPGYFNDYLKAHNVALPSN